MGFVCKECGKGFRSASGFKLHGFRHQSKVVPCSQCPRKYPSQLLANKHAQRVHTDKAHGCTECGSKFKNSTALRVHQLIHNPPQFNCPVCEKSFNWKPNLTDHMLRIHSTDKEFKCTLCDKSYASERILKVHYSKVHAKEWNKECPDCGKKCKGGVSGLQKHMVTHTRKSKFMCAFCNYAGVNQCQLEDHVRTHTGEKPFKCTDCDSAFTSKSILNNHQKTHKDQTYKIHKCPFCPYSSIGGLDRHIRGKHTRERPYGCTKCPLMFKYNQQLTIHHRTHTGEKPYGCDICQKLFYSMKALTGHRNTHDEKRKFKCGTCGKGFRHRGHMKSHEHLHTGIKGYTCNLCQAKFPFQSYLNRHIQSQHTKEKPYGCDKCGKFLSTSLGMRHHLKKHLEAEKYVCRVCLRAYGRVKDLVHHASTHLQEKWYVCNSCYGTLPNKPSLEDHLQFQSKQCKCAGVIRPNAFMQIITIQLQRLD